MARQDNDTTGLCAEIDSCKYLYLREIGEPQDNELRLLVEEADASETMRSMSLPGDVVLTGSEIRSDDKSRLFELSWSFYIAYSVRNESYVIADETEAIQSGHLLRLYAKSRFLDYISRSTFASKDHPGGPLPPVEVVCLNHVIDVISIKLRQIRQLRPPRWSIQ